MAEDFHVRFLGGVPIDPQFVMLVETGRRPRYPKGTVINGTDFSEIRQIHNTDADTPVEDAKDASLLASKYLDCSLEPIFRKITQDIVTAIG